RPVESDRLKDWTQEDVEAALIKHWRETGDFPNYQDLADVDSLPSRDVVRWWLGGEETWPERMNRLSAERDMPSDRYSDRLWSRDSVCASLLQWFHVHGDLPSTEEVAGRRELPGMFTIMRYLAEPSWPRAMFKFAEEAGIVSARYSATGSCIRKR